MKKIFRRLNHGLHLVFEWLFNFLFGRLLGAYKEYTVKRIIEKTGRHPDSYPSPQVTARFAGYRFGPNTAAFKGGRKRIRGWQNGYEVVGAVASVKKRTGRFILRGGVKCKRKSQRAIEFHRSRDPIPQEVKTPEPLQARIRSFMRSINERKKDGRDLSLS
jgi:hypothetical protein